MSQNDDSEHVPFITIGMVKLAPAVTGQSRSEPMPQSHLRHKSGLPSTAESMLWGLGVWQGRTWYTASMPFCQRLQHAFISEKRLQCVIFCLSLQYTEKQ